jgi:antitoxin VapB
MAALNIKNEETYKLVKELADLRGETMTAVITEAVREKLERERKPQINEERMQYFLDLGRRIRETADPEWLAKDPFEELYDDELGLPK